MATIQSPCCRVKICHVTTGPPNGPVLFCSLSSVVCPRRLSSSVTLPAGGQAGRPAAGRVGGRAADTARRAITVTSRYGDTLFKQN